jgi:hypothetical protein
VLADAQGRPLHLMLGAGQQHTCKWAVELLQTVSQTGKVLTAMGALRAEAVIPSQPRRHVPRVIEEVFYRQRNHI